MFYFCFIPRVFYNFVQLYTGYKNSTNFAVELNENGWTSPMWVPMSHKFNVVNSRRQLAVQAVRTRFGLKFWKTTLNQTKIFDSVTKCVVHNLGWT